MVTAEAQQQRFVERVREHKKKRGALYGLWRQAWCLEWEQKMKDSINRLNHVNELLILHGADFVNAAYQTLLGRAPDPTGMHHYISLLAQGYGKPSILNDIAQSTEAQRLYNVGDRLDLGDEDFVEFVYRTLLRRVSDAEGKRYYLNRLHSGKSRRSIIADIRNSAEANLIGLNLPGLKALCEDERRANHWFWRYWNWRRYMQRQVHRLNHDVGGATQRIIAQSQQHYVQLRTWTDALASRLDCLQQTITPPPTVARPGLAELRHADFSAEPVVVDPGGVMPRILHRVYFENYSPFYDPFLHYLETWRRELPEYQIMKWGHGNVDVSANEWLHRSAEAKDPVFLSEFVRWDVLKRYGGIYLDSDCEVLNGGKFDALVDELANSSEYDAFVGVEEFYNGHPTAQTIAAKKGAALVDFMRNLYMGPLSGPLWHWRAERGLIGPQLISLYFREHGLADTKGFPIQLKEPIIVGRVKIYPQEYFSPKFTTTGKKLSVSENTCIYHLFANLNVKDVDPEAERHRRNPLLFNEYCDYLAKIAVGQRPAVQANGDAEVDRLKKAGIRKLHRIYFGFDGKPDPYRRYLDTWSQQMPSYEIYHWNATNLPIDNCHWSRLMFEMKDHAFLSDYFRWWILREHGGMYLDADVEITNGKLLDKLITELNNDDYIHAFIGIDNKADGWYTAHSMACKQGSQLAQFMCQVYEGLGEVSLWRRKIFYLMAPQLTSLYFAKNGWNVEGMGGAPNLHTPVIIGGVKVYPQDWFSPMRPQMKDGVGSFEIDSYTENTCLCHHFSCSWHSDDSPFKRCKDHDSAPLLDELVNNYL